jgi:hypothetical protein
LSFSDVSDAYQFFPSPLKISDNPDYEPIRGTAGSPISVTNETLPEFLTTSCQHPVLLQNGVVELAAHQHLDHLHRSLAALLFPPLDLVVGPK